MFHPQCAATDGIVLVLTCTGTEWPTSADGAVKKLLTHWRSPWKLQRTGYMLACRVFNATSAASSLQ